VESLQSAWEEARSREVERGEAVGTASFAYASDGEQVGEIVSEQHVEDLDLWLFTFANGVRLNVKATDFKKREIQLAARVAEGLLTLAPEEYAVGWVATQGVVNLAGLEAHSVDELRRLTAGKQVGIGFNWAQDSFTFGGSTTEEDLLFELELLCANLEHPGWRDDGVRMLRDRLPLMFERFEHVPDGPMVLEFLPELYHGDERLVQLPARKAIEAVTIADVQKWLTPHLSDGPLEVTLVGDLDLEAVKAAAARTLGALPDRRERQAFAERRKVQPPKSGIEMSREIETEDDKCLVMLIFPADDGIDSIQRREINFLSQVIMDRLRLEVRERLGTAYSPFAFPNLSRTFVGFGILGMGASVEPDKVDELVGAFRAVAKELVEGGITAEEVKRLSEPNLAQIRDQKRTNGFWLTVLSDAQERAEALDDIRTVESWQRAIDPERIHARAKAYLSPEKASLYVARPAASPETEETEKPAGEAIEAGSDD
jgi:zinc protease